MKTAEDIFEFLVDAKVFYLATAEGDQPRVRPYGAQLFYEGKIYIMAFGETNATHQIAANPKAEICAFNKGKTLRIECKLVKDDRPEVNKALAEKMPALRPALGDNGEKGVMYYLSEATASSYKMMELEDVVTF